MANSENWEKEFQQIVGSMSNDSDPSDELLALIERANELTLGKELAQTNYLNVLASVNRALFFAIVSATLLGIAWSFYAWFK